MAKKINGGLKAWLKKHPNAKANKIRKSLRKKAK